MKTMKLIAARAHIDLATDLKDTSKRLKIANSDDPRDVSLAGIESIELDFPKFTDGRAFSQAFLLSRRLGFKGEIVATGDVLLTWTQNTANELMGTNTFSSPAGSSRAGRGSESP